MPRVRTALYTQAFPYKHVLTCFGARARPQAVPSAEREGMFAEHMTERERKDREARKAERRRRMDAFRKLLEATASVKARARHRVATLPCSHLAAAAHRAPARAPAHPAPASACRGRPGATPFTACSAERERHRARCHTAARASLWEARVK